MFSHLQIHKAHLSDVPELSRFEGIRITMHWRDHQPAHFHAHYSGDEALVKIEPVRIFEGTLPNSERSLVLQWARRHQDKLKECWELAEDMSPIGKIEPLE